MIRHRPSATARRRICRTLTLCAVSSLLALGVTAGRAADLPIGAATAQLALDNPMYTDPAIIPAPAVPSFDPQIGDLLLAALQRPDVETRRQAAAAWATAWREGAPPNPAALARLITLTTAPEDILRRTAAAALVAADDPSAGPTLVALIPTADAELLDTLRPALVHWKTPGAAPAIVDRIKSWQAPDGIGVALAALPIAAQLHAVPAAPVAVAIATDQTASPALRLAAASAIASFGPPPLDQIARPLANSHNDFDHLVAATSLVQSDDVPTLLRLARDHEPAVRALAVIRLAAAYPNDLAPLNATLLADPDDNVRAALARALTAQATTHAIPLLVTLLNDPIDTVRASARIGLIALDAHADLQSTVRQAVDGTLKNPAGWHAGAEASFVAGAIHAAAMEDDLIALLDAPDIHDRCAAARALAQLPATHAVAPLYKRAAALAKRPPNAKITAEQARDGDLELSTLLQSLALLHDQAAEPLCKSLVPKSVPFLASRVAAIWALGKLEENHPDGSLAGALMGRLTDRDMLHPEAEEVQFMAAITIGRLHDPGSVGSLRSLMADPRNGPSIPAIRWALGQITGQPQPPLPPDQRIIAGFFLEPLNP